jgi:hypothetical protein
MLDWQQLALWPDSFLTPLDIAEVNLACAVGLPGADRFDPQAVLARLDNWAAYVRRYSDRCLPEFHADPAPFRNSEGYFRILVLVTALQRDMGLRYNPAKIPDDVPFDANDTFISGAILGAGGTCASIPVVIAAVGRRLGYPIKLVAARSQDIGHLFARWDDPHGERFNIEATGQGLSSSSDDYYRTGEYQITLEQEQKLCLLKSMTPSEELADFITQRGFRWLELGQMRRAVEAFGFAYGLAPQNRGYHNRLGKTLETWHNEIESRKPPRFPTLCFKPFPPPRVFPLGLAAGIEKDILGLTAQEYLLNAPELNQQLWDPLRRGIILARPVPVAIDIRFTSPAVCHMEARYAQVPPRPFTQGVAHA